LEAGGGEVEVAFGPAAAFGRGVAEGGEDEAFLFEAVEGGVDAAEGDVAAGEGEEFLGDGDTVGLVFEAEDGEENEEFQFAEGGPWRHFFNYREEINRVQGNSRFLSGWAAGWSGMRRIGQLISAYFAEIVAYNLRMECGD
jgi:hypothetical protein